MKKLNLLSGLLLLQTSLSAYAFTVGNKLEGGLHVVKNALKTAHVHANLTGHEEITRQALILTIEEARKNRIRIPKELGDLGFQNLSATEFGLIGSEATNPLIQGNYATDFPFTKQYEVDLPAFWGITDVKANMEWQDHPKTQQFHFLRNHLQSPDERGSILEGQRKSCHTSRDLIIRVTKVASNLFRKKTTTPQEREGNVKKVLFLLGHATHIIQDSFSEAHGRRHGRDQNYDLREMCYFGFDLDAVRHPRSHKVRLNSCHHSMGEIISDGIWIRRPTARARVADQWPGEPVIGEDPKELKTCLANYTSKVKNNEICLKHTPRLARTATARYLLVLLHYIQKNESEDLRPYLMRNLFEGSLGLGTLDETMEDGIMRCENLPV